MAATTKFGILVSTVEPAGIRHCNRVLTESIYRSHSQTAVFPLPYRRNSTCYVTLQVRNLSTSSSASQLVKAPVQVFGVEGRYATALYSAATKLKSLEAVEKDVTEIQKVLRTNRKVRENIASPIVQRRAMAGALKDAATKTNMSAATSNLLEVMAENGRLKRLDGVISAFKTIMAAHRGEVVCEVTTAKALDQAQLQQLQGALKKFVSAKESIQLTAKVDPTIIGGMVVSIGDKYIDMSIASKVKKYTDILKQPC